MKDTTWLDPISLQAHSTQWHSQRESTKAFASYLQEILGEESKKVIDLGCGTGAPTYFLANRFKSSTFIGVDLSHDLIKIACGMDLVKSQTNLSFQTGDMFNLKRFSNIDCVTSLQTLSWLSEFETPLEQIFTKINPKYIVISSLFYEGDITAKTIITENVKERSVFYNTYSIPEIERFSMRFGYEKVGHKPFKIPTKLARPKNLNIMGTYTVDVSNDDSIDRLQISGPVLMNQMFLSLRRVN